VRDHRVALRRFFVREFPAALRAERRFVAVSAALMLLGALVGAGVVWFEPRGAELLVPAHLRAIVAQHRLWTDDLLSAMPPSLVSSTILTNNLTVAVGLFALGASAGVGTALVLLYNGLHVGAIGAHCARADLGFEFLSFVGAHGPVELSIIAIAGAAGLMLGDALLHPGELPRGDHLRARARQAVRLLLGCAPFLTAIGVVEGYVSPGALFPGAFRIALGLALGAAFWGYLLRAGRSAA
jgi:uncharacterized membrane protein SpoIIM required for sporulation